MRKKSRRKNATSHGPSPKGAENSRARLALSLGGSVFAAVRALRQARRRSRGTHGKLGKAGALAGAAPVVASAVMAVRELRRASHRA